MMRAKFVARVGVAHRRARASIAATMGGDELSDGMLTERVVSTRPHRTARDDTH